MRRVDGPEASVSRRRPVRWLGAERAVVLPGSLNTGGELAYREGSTGQAQLRLGKGR